MFQELLESLLKATSNEWVTAIQDGVHFTRYPSGVLNVDGRARDLTREDVAAVRDAFDQLGYDELDAWLPRVGMSWLSDGVSAGVSFRLAARS